MCEIGSTRLSAGCNVQFRRVRWTLSLRIGRRLRACVRRLDALMAGTLRISESEAIATTISHTHTPSAHDASHIHGHVLQQHTYAQMPYLLHIHHTYSIAHCSGLPSSSRRNPLCPSPVATLLTAPARRRVKGARG